MRRLFKLTGNIQRKSLQHFSVKPERKSRTMVLEGLSQWRLSMPTPVQYPLEHSRALQQKWSRLLQDTGMNGPHGFVANTMPPRDPDDDDEEDEEDERR